MVIELSKFIVPTLKATELTTGAENGFNLVVINFTKPAKIKHINAALEAK